MERAVRIVVLGNAAAGAEKQALALGARLRDRLLRRQPQLSATSAPPVSVSCMRVPLRSDSIAHKLPPLLHVAAAVLIRDPFFGYDLSDAHKKELSSGGSDKSHQMPSPSHPLSVVIGCGRTTVALCTTLKLMARQPADVFNIQIQHPRVALSWFDAVVAPRHDFVSAHTHPSLHVTTGTVYDISSELLKCEAKQWRGELTKHVGERRACVAWLVGGPCRGFAFTPEDARAMVTQFANAVRHSVAHQPAVLVTFSRRTPTKVVEIIERELRASFAATNQLFVWDGEGCNPFHAFLGLATVVVTTPDSISMTTEAIASAKAVLTISADRAQGKFRRFHEALFAARLTAPFTNESFSIAMMLTDSSSSDTQYGSASSREQRAMPSEVLERELNAITDAIVEQIHERAQH